VFAPIHRQAQRCCGQPRRYLCFVETGTPPFCYDRYCARRGAEGGVGPAKGGGAPADGPGSGAGAAFEPNASGAGAGAADCLSSGTGAGAEPDFGSAGVGNEGPSASPTAGEGAAVEVETVGRARSSPTEGGCTADCPTTLAPDDTATAAAALGVPSTVTTTLPLSVFRMKL
jgi:hypothetical protein